MRNHRLGGALSVLFLLCTTGGSIAQSAGQSAPATQPWRTDLVKLTTALDDMSGRQAVLLRNHELTRRELGLQAVYGERMNAVRLVYTANTPGAAYLGIGVESPSDTLRAQLVLPEGAGLVVDYVDEKAPSNGAVHKHDVLQKLDDQILVNADQLMTLVRMHKPGESVSLTLIREAKPITVEVKLGTKQDDEMRVSFFPYTLQDVSGTIDLNVSQAAPPSTQPTGVPVLKDIPIINKMFVTPLASGELKSRPITFNDGELLACIDGAGDLLAIDVKTGSLIFRGPIATEEQWKNAPQIVRDKLAAWKEMIAPPNKGQDQGERTGK